MFPTGNLQEAGVRPVSAEEVEIGKPLPWSVYDRDGALLFGQGMVVAGEAHLGIVLARGMIVPETATSAGQLEPPTEDLPDPAATSDGDPAAAGDDDQDAGADPGPEAEPEGLGLPGLPEEPRPPVFATLQRMRVELEHLHAAIAEGRGEDLALQVLDLAIRLRALVGRDADAALAAMQLEVADDAHSARLLHAATLCQMLVQALEWDEDESLSLVAAALTFDVALTPMAATLNRQESALTPDQRAMVDAHPQFGVELLRVAGVDDAVWLEAIAHHHERLDGSGYPGGLRDTAICRGARLLAIVDIYSAMVRPRAWREAVHARLALRSLFLERGRLVDESLAARLVREIGVFPPGTPVMLANGEVGVVWRRGSNATHPVVARLVNANGTLAAIPVRRDTALEAFAITATVPPHKYQLLVSGAARLWE
ncbi:HD domain-containing protein [Lysobacter sp. GX 14042]|uniref:HD-GYP domain-containing protein n=1 Tax=Lysobacter sp. GX 14042 TaxID=2907155 RepID=UPI001F4135CD|nr:HD domain-containing protein [Lysobacter sp. GX 14042]